MTDQHTSARILVLSGSIRTGSINMKLAIAATRELQGQANDVKLINLADYPAPIYNGDDEAANGLPPSMSTLKKVFTHADALVIASPEYNGFIPPLLVNTFSWLSRPEGQEKSQALTGKIASIMAASPGGLGGIRVMPRLRDCLAELGVTVLPGYVTIKSALSAFDANGALTQQADQDALTSEMSKLTAALAS